MLIFFIFPSSKTRLHKVVPRTPALAFLLRKWSQWKHHSLDIFQFSSSLTSETQATELSSPPLLDFPGFNALVCGFPPIALAVSSPSPLGGLSGLLFSHSLCNLSLRGLIHSYTCITIYIWL